jgi:TonB family protein
MRGNWIGRTLLLGLAFAILALSACVANHSRAPLECTNVVLPDGHREPLSTVSPDYPSRAVRRRIEGFVKLRGFVSANGAVTNIEIEESHPAGIFDRSAKKAWSQWQYCPEVAGVDDTEPIVVTLKFALR